MRRRTKASITVVQVRSYSRYSPETRCESETSPSKPASRSSRSASSSWRRVGVGVHERDRHRVDALGSRTPRPPRRRRLGVERRGDSAPSARIRPPTGSRRWRGDERRRRAPEQVVRVVAVAAAHLEHVAEAARCTSRPTGAPRRSSSAFRPTVVPCRKYSDEATSPSGEHRLADRRSTPSSGASGRSAPCRPRSARCPSSLRIRSVNVPPTSTPIRVRHGGHSDRYERVGQCVAIPSFPRNVCSWHTGGMRIDDVLRRNAGHDLTLVAGPWDARIVERVSVIDDTARIAGLAGESWWCSRGGRHGARPDAGSLRCSTPAAGASWPPWRCMDARRRHRRLSVRRAAPGSPCWRSASVRILQRSLTPSRRFSAPTPTPSCDG